jgi:hypothetical protein
MGNLTLYNVVDDGGADPTGVTDSTSALQAVAAIAGNKLIYFPAGTYKVTDTIAWTADHTRVMGAGPGQTYINFQPTTTNKACFTFSKGGATPAIQAFCGLSQMRFSSTSNTQDGKIAVLIEVTEEFAMSDIRVSDWSSTSKNCIGLKSRGWQLNTFERFHFYADIPISIHINPSSFLDIDFNHFEDMILAPATTQPCIFVEDGVFLTNVSFKGIAMVGGTYGFYWNDTGSPGNSYNLSFEQCRVEQRNDVNAYSFYLNRTGSPLENTRFVDCYMDSTCNGIYARKIRKLSCENTVFSSTTKECINFVSESGMAIDFRNCTFPSSGSATATLTGYRMLTGGEKSASAAPIPSTAHYAHDTANRNVHQKMDDVFQLAYHGTLADDATLNLQCGSGTGYVLANIAVSMRGSTQREGMVCFADTAINVFKIAGTTKTSVADVDNNLCVYRSTSNIFLKNRLGESVTYVVQISATP